MKLKKILLAGSVLFLVYNAGRIAGGLDTFKSILNKYGSINLEGEKEIVCAIGKSITIVASQKGA